jgi:hypothetical protein
MKSIFEIALAIMASVGGAGIILFALSSWLGKIWASRILEKQRKDYQLEIESFKEKISKGLEELKGAIDSRKSVLSSLLTHNENIQEKKYEILNDIWKITIDIDTFCGKVTKYYYYLTPDDIKHDNENRKILKTEITKEKIEENFNLSESVRYYLPLISFDLWNIFFKYSTFEFRLLSIYLYSINEFDWRNDDIIKHLLTEFFNSEEIDKINEGKIASPNFIVNEFQMLILDKIKEDLSGKRLKKQSIKDYHDILKLEEITKTENV